MTTFDPGSFRDPNNRVFLHQGKVYRALNQEATADWEALRATSMYEQWSRAGRLVSTRRGELAGELLAFLGEGSGWDAILEHERVPFLSYPYEWSFGMLKDAALLQLDLLGGALEENLILKDSSAFNIQWIGAEPVFIDLASFQRLRAGAPWEGYGQFCRMFLYPLMLQAYKGVDFQPWLRGAIDGIEAPDMDRLMSLRDALRPGVLTHVKLQARLQTRYSDTDTDIRSDLERRGFNKALIVANVARLRKLVGGLEWKPPRSEWSEYELEHGYDEGDRARKEDFVESVVGERHRSLAWDLGCNTGRFSRICARNTDLVVAMDIDSLAVDRFYRKLRGSKNSGILPLVMNLAQPSPGLGWRGAERRGLFDRPKPDLILALALIHHVTLQANVPFDEFLPLLAALAPELVIEFPSREDPMVKKLLLNKSEVHPGYNRRHFEEMLHRHFEVIRSEPLSSGTRFLYLARSKAPADSAARVGPAER